MRLCDHNKINTSDAAVANDELRMRGSKERFSLYLLCLFSKTSDTLLTGGTLVELITNLELRGFFSAPRCIFSGELEININRTLEVTKLKQYQTNTNIQIKTW